MTLTPTNKLLLDLVREWGADLVTAKLHHYRQFRNTPAEDVAAWALSEMSPTEKQIQGLTVALPKIREQLRKKKREPVPPAPENG